VRESFRRDHIQVLWCIGHASSIANSVGPYPTWAIGDSLGLPFAG
jgi:hypothetical protein